MSDLEDFEEQLRQEKEAAETAATRKTKTDEDGTEYEWDPVKEAWFPRIDADFIAKYQLSYGNDDSAENPDTQPKVQQDYLTYEDFVKFYYGNYREALDIEHHLESGKDVEKVDQEAKAKKLMKEDGSIEMCEEANKLYLEYCEEYYKSWQTGNYDYFRRHYNYEPEEGEEVEDKKKKKNKTGAKRKKDDGWFDAEGGVNTNVYVSGLPSDITHEEFSELMGKAGMVMYDPATRKPKLKLYQDENGVNKGDGRCCYIKPESVDLAIQFLDNSDFRGSTIHIEKAHFTLKGNYDPSKRKKISNKQKKKLKEQQSKLFDWRPDRDRFVRPKNERTVILKKMFLPNEFEADPTLINETKDEIKTECMRFGDVKKVVVYDRNTDGVASVTFAEAAAADECVKFMNKRWFAKRQISAETWDGKSKYHVEETEEQREERLKKWQEYLDKGDDAGEEKTVEVDQSGKVSIELTEVAGKDGGDTTSDADKVRKEADNADKAEDGNAHADESHIASSD